MSLLEIIILSIIEGITEFLPISSTGHMILAADLMQMENTEFLKTFEISIQFAAILAVVIMYRDRLLAGITLYYKLFWAFIPTAVVGLLFYSAIKGYLFNTIVVSITLILGGIALVLLDRWTKNRERKIATLESISTKGALTIGFMQCLALIPGTSRAAATIIGGVVAGYNHKQATEFSFLLAIPTMAAATGYDLLKTASAITSEQFFLLLMGGFFAFVFAWLAVKIFLKIVVDYGFRHFGYYRIALGGLFLILTWLFDVNIF
jgi:undecaprenyl-diphosphatase